MQFEIRPLQISDYDDLIALWQRSGLSHRPKGRDTYEAIAIELQRPETCFYGMFDGDKMIGSVVGSSDGRKGWINRLAVDPDYRGQGLAGRLIKECENFLYRLGLKVIAALIEGENTESLATFKKAKYELWNDITYCSKRFSPED
jgi:ribosomal protein S18 acetylase RimI-like enzyme